MSETYQTYDITLTGSGSTLDLSIEVETSLNDKIDTQYSDDSGNPIVAVSGSLLLSGSTTPVTFSSTLGSTNWIGVNDFLGNDNLYVAGTEPTALDYSGVSFVAGGVDYNLFYHVGGPDDGWTLDDGSKSDPTHVISGSGVTFTITPVCFASGTLIRTVRGEIAVETLEIGDKVVTASGVAQRIVWIGHKRIERPSPEQQPVRVMAGAFGEHLPSRDLRLSHGHAVCVEAVGEVLVPVGVLVNDATVVREEVAEVTYWHVELESHDVLLAEGLACESYLDTGNRMFFGRAHGRLATIEPDRTLADSCRPFVAEGPIVIAVRERLAARAEVLAVSEPAPRRAA
jgi:hypothetical protein